MSLGLKRLADFNVSNIVHEEFRMNPRTILKDITIPADFNAVTVGPVFIGMSTKVTIEHGAVWRII